MPHTMHFKGVTDAAAEQHIFIAIPAYGGMDAPCCLALFATQVALQAAGIPADLCIIAEHCHVDDARNDLVRQFLETDCTHIMWIDSDLYWDGADVVKLARAGKDIAAGIYPLKADTEGFPVNTLPGEMWAGADGFMEVLTVPGGFTCVARHVMQDLYDKSDRPFLGRKDEPDRLPIKIIYERVYIDGARRSGDVHFCYLARDAGYSIHIDPLMHFEHYGDHSWGGDVGSYWRRINGIAFDGPVKQLRERTETDRTFVDLVMAWGNGWSVWPDMLSTLTLTAREINGPILEIGSGITTLVLALATDQHIDVLEHDPVFYAKTKQLLDKFGIQNVTLHCKPLKEFPNGKWYDFQQDFANYALLLVDGPPRDQGNRNVFLDVMGKYALTPGAIVIMDDAGMDDGAKRTKLWGDALGTNFSLMGDKRKFAICRMPGIEKGSAA